MTQLDVLLAARAAATREAQLRRAVRQRRLAGKPMVVVPFQPGGEAHTVAALGWGDRPDRLHSLVIPQPLNRQHLFDGLQPFIEWFSTRFEQAWQRTTLTDDGDYAVPHELLPQVIVPNQAGVAALGRIGRRLAYLPTDKSSDPDAPPPAPPELVRFGRQLRWLAGQASTPSQNLIVDLTTETQHHWATVQSVNERAHLLALDAWISPPPGLDPDEAADEAERRSVGPYAVPSEEHPMGDLVEQWYEAQQAGKSTGRLTRQLEQGWRALIEPVWETSWRSIERLRGIPADTAHLPRRIKRDAQAYARQMAWLDGPAGGRTRTRQTPRQAIWAKKMAEWEAAVVEAEERVSDPLALVDECLAGKAVHGRIVAVDLTYRELKPGNQTPTPAPLVTIESPRHCLIPASRELWWTEDCDRVAAVIHRVDNADDGTATVTLKLTKGGRDAGGRFTIAKAKKRSAAFSVYTTKQFFPAKLPPGDPFSHREPVLAGTHIEDGGGAA